jgi:hypothetical protein
MIVPSGLPDLHQFSRQESRHFMLNGTPDTDLEGVQFKLDGGLYDAPSGISIFQTYPKPNYVSGGTLRPRMGKTGLWRDRTIAMYYPGIKNAKEYQIMDFNTGEWRDIGAAGGDKDLGGVRFLKLLMASAVVGRGGSDTGELIVAYPMSSVHSIETSPEMLRMQLRTHLGAALYRTENCMVLPDVHCEGIVQQWDLEKPDAEIKDTGKTKGLGGKGGDDPSNKDVERIPSRKIDVLISREDMPRIAYRGAYRYKLNGDTTWTTMRNAGHLGPLDCPEGMTKLRGHNVFQRTPVQVQMTSC